MYSFERLSRFLLLLKKIFCVFLLNAILLALSADAQSGTIGVEFHLLRLPSISFPTLHIQFSQSIVSYAIGGMKNE